MSEVTTTVENDVTTTVVEQTQGIPAGYVEWRLCRDASQLFVPLNPLKDQCGSSGTPITVLAKTTAATTSTADTTTGFDISTTSGGYDISTSTVPSGG